MLNTNNSDQSNGQNTTPNCNDTQYDDTMLSSAERKHRDDAILEAYLEYEEFMNHENSYRSAA